MCITTDPHASHKYVREKLQRNSKTSAEERTSFSSTPRQRQMGRPTQADRRTGRQRRVQLQQLMGSLQFLWANLSGSPAGYGTLALWQRSVKPSPRHRITRPSEYVGVVVNDCSEGWGRGGGREWGREGMMTWLTLRLAISVSVLPVRQSVFLRICLSVRLSLCMSVCMHVRMQTPVLVCMLVCVSVSVCVCVC